MAELGSLRTGQFIVRQQPSWRWRVWLVAGALAGLVLLYVMYEWGRFEGGYSKFAEIQHRRELVARIETLEQDNERLRAAVAAAQLARDVDGRAYGDVEKALADLQAQVLKQREELTFYRGIVSPEDGIGGLRIQRFQIFPAGPERHYRLHLVLVQSMRQDALVSGSVVMQVEGTRAGRTEQLGVAGTGAPPAKEQLPFHFRYFQNLEQDIVLPEGFEPRVVMIEVRAGQRAPVRGSYPWQVQAEA